MRRRRARRAAHLRRRPFEQVLGATGVANIFELTQHLRGRAGERQVEGAQVGLAHVIGLGSACTINILGV